MLILRLLLRMMKPCTMMLIAFVVGARVRVVARADQTLDGRTSHGHDGMEWMESHRCPACQPASQPGRVDSSQPISTPTGP